MSAGFESEGKALVVDLSRAPSREAEPFTRGNEKFHRYSTNDFTGLLREAEATSNEPFPTATSTLWEAADFAAGGFMYLTS